MVKPGKHGRRCGSVFGDGGEMVGCSGLACRNKRKTPRKHLVCKGLSELGN